MTQDVTTARRRLSLVSLLVRDYDEAIAFYVSKLGFQLIEDTRLSNEKRWVVVSPNGGQASLLLAKAIGKQTAAIGQQAGGRVFLFLETDNFARDHARFLAAGVIFREQPRVEAYGTVAVFEDLYGNPWDLIEPAMSNGFKSEAEVG
ncbi:VOC family protein [Rhizobium bangladeshense]|uniref:VOC family protein n=1 Tax=Rhizobium bangladeshense TaxID=1138189 RepID=A0ABS7LMG6_9HYPH|nr:VOC family protein [Rhizobium bangladeshense]MBX4874713.1 VOC family protein [Rhizobium bangladeshense]MBX4885246.1 VOC family protein [Rhizobium bangladeshense]MBX4899159.1 VOC family protein [Rhizobium bangladeshense]MBX4902477.1 VOC family protein [Rhizobium bangladeshense]MBX4932115.1 VOC family protein [Rhizobium bangladeshense]